jgi:hypothetical protein
VVEQSDADPCWQIDLIPADPHACAVSLAGGYPPEMFMDVGRDPAIGSCEFWEHVWSANLALLRDLLEAMVKGWHGGGDHHYSKPQDYGREMDMKKSELQKSESPSQLIDARIKELGDWRGKMLSRLRTLVKETDPEVFEEWKWRGVPVWSHDGLICTGETYKNVVKMTFAKGAALKDPSGLFNSSLDGNTRRAIDFHAGETIDEEALKTLVRAAVTLNKSTAQS